MADEKLEGQLLLVGDAQSPRKAFRAETQLYRRGLREKAEKLDPTRTHQTGVSPGAILSVGLAVGRV